MKAVRSEICGLQSHDIMIVSWKACCRPLIFQCCERDGRTSGKQNIWVASYCSYLKEMFLFLWGELPWRCSCVITVFTIQPKEEKHYFHSVEWDRGENHLCDMSSVGRRLWSQQFITLHYLFFYMCPTRWKIHPVWSQPAWLLPPFARTVKISPQKDKGDTYSVSLCANLTGFIIMFESTYFPTNSACMRACLCVASTLQSRCMLIVH